MILSGLPELKIEDLSNSLTLENKLKPNKIIVLSKNSANYLYLIHFNRNDVNMSLLKEHDIVYMHRIKWVPYKPRKRGPTQCYQCAMFGHGASYCKRPPTCILCGEAHAAKDCVNILKEDFVPKCVNCFDCNLECKHKATDINCPMRARYSELRKRSVDKTRQKHTPKQRANVHTANRLNEFVPAPQPPPLRQTFAHAARMSAQTPNRRAGNNHCSYNRQNSNNNHINSNHNNNNRINQFDFDMNGSANDLWSFAEISNILLNSLNALAKCKNKYDQLKVITDMLQNVID